MTSIVRPVMFNPRARHQQREKGLQSALEAAELAIDDMSDDAERLCREARQRVEQERVREGER